MKTLLLAILLLTSLPAAARIGEDIWQLRTRYGKEISQKDYGKNGITYHFRKNKLNIECHTYQGKTVTIRFTVELQNKAELDLETAFHLVSVNSGPEKMQIDKDKEDSVNYADWKNQDGTRRANLYYDKFKSPILTIGLNEFLNGSIYMRNMDPKPDPPPQNVKDF